MDDDGPCAVPQGSAITESISEPLFNIGMIFLSISLFLAMSYYSDGNFLGINNRLVFQQY